MLDRDGRAILVEISLEADTDVPRKKRQLEQYASGFPGSGAFLFASTGDGVVIAALRPDGTWDDFVATGDEDADSVARSAERVLELVGA
jgi:hypothetical protein